MFTSIAPIFNHPTMGIHKAVDPGNPVCFDVFVWAFQLENHRQKLISIVDLIGK
jgi:hypothetical protein